MNLEEAAQLVGTVLVSYPSQGGKINDAQQIAMAKVWRDMLGDFTYAQCNAALRLLVQTRQFMPTIAEIRSAVLDLERGPVTAGGDAWGDVLAAMKSKGAHRTPGIDFTFPDVTTARCVQRLGWRDLCLSENTMADRARFIELYDKLAVEQRREAQSPALAAARERRQLAAGESQTQQVGKLIALVAGKLGGA
jgi:hypothetical protein